MKIPTRHRERGATLAEFSITSAAFLLALFGVLDFGRLLWTHNALADAARQGARHAVSNSVNSVTEVKNVVVYRNAAGGATPIVTGLTIDHVDVVYDNVGLGRGTATIRISGYRFRFVALLLGVELELPEYQTTLTGETMGFAPPRI